MGVSHVGCRQYGELGTGIGPSQAALAVEKEAMDKEAGKPTGELLALTLMR